MATPVKKLKAKKKWFSIIASHDFGDMKLGETSAFEPEQVKGRVVKLNLGGLTGDMKRQGKIAAFKIKEIQGANAFAEFVGMEMTPMNIKRIVRKGRMRIDDSFEAETKDGVRVRIKPFFITRSKTQHGVHTASRKIGRDFVAQQLKAKTYSETVMDIINGSLQRDLKAAVKKVYPFAVVEIRQFQKL